MQAWGDHGQVPLGGSRQLKLFAFLLLNANRAVSADTLIDAVWGPERDGAIKRLQMAIARLRKALARLETDETSVLRTVGGGYLLEVRMNELDADVFADRIRQGRRVLEAGDPARASELLGEALELWRGPPLAELAFEDFAQAEIRRLEELRLSALEARIDAHLKLGRHAELIEELEALLAEEPTRERLTGQLMTALYRSGRQADALEVYQRTRMHLAEQLGLDPGPTLQTLEAQVLAHASALQWTSGVQSHPGQGFSRRGVPSPATPTVGREREVNELTALLRDSGVRLVTIAGPGGVGKTRLALAVAQDLAAEFPDGVGWVELAGVSRPEDVDSTLVRALDITPAEGERPSDALSRYLASRRFLLVADNFEHVLDAARLIGELIATCPHLTVLATSREALNLAGEHHYVLAPMPLPARPRHATVGEVEATAGTALFLAAARRREHGFTVTSATAPVVAELCARLDGLPLALELAAARVGLLTLDELTTRLRDALSSLGPGPRNAPERHRTLSATIEWSYRLLSEDERRAFNRFAVFAGGATLAAAETITGASLDTLDALRAKSLLRAQHGSAAPRLTMLDTLREFALSTFDDQSDLRDARGRHCEYYLHLVEATVDRLSTSEEAAALQTLEAELHNIRGAAGWALSADPATGLKLVARMGDYWFVRRDLDGLAWIEAALAAAGDRAPAQDRARAQLAHASQLAIHDREGAGIEAASIALELYRESHDEVGMANAYCSLAINCMRTGQTAMARTSAEAACALARDIGDDALLGRATSRLASVLPRPERHPVVEQARRLLADSPNQREVVLLYLNAAYSEIVEDHPREALRLLDVALLAAEKLSTPVSRMLVLGNLGLANLLVGNQAEARSAFVAQLRLCIGEAFRFGADEGLVGLAATFVIDGHLEQAATLLGAGSALGYPGSHPLDQTMFDRLDRDYFAGARDRLGSAAWTSLVSKGATLLYDQAIDFALAESAYLDHESPLAAAG